MIVGIDGVVGGPHYVENPENLDGASLIGRGPLPHSALVESRR